jgi:hypothetical protein
VGGCWHWCRFLKDVLKRGGKNKPGRVPTLKVNCIRLIMPGRAFWEASRERSRSTARHRVNIHKDMGRRVVLMVARGRRG